MLEFLTTLEKNILRKLLKNLLEADAKEIEVKGGVWATPFVQGVEVPPAKTETKVVRPAKTPYSLGTNERVRFLKDDKGRYAVLFSKQLYSGRIVFGISRCNRKAGDVFDRAFGVQQARDRASKVQEKRRHQFGENYYSADGMSGTVTIDTVTDMLEHFRAVAGR